MEGNQTKNIEKSLNALRVIKHTVYSKRFYPGNFDTDFWEEKDFGDSSFRESIRAEFERYIELYVELNNKYVIALQESATELESEYNQIVVSSVNLEQALKHFREQYRAALFNIEQECDLNRILLRYLNPLKKHGIITMNESSGYQDVLSNIGWICCRAVDYICNLFNIKRPWEIEEETPIKEDHDSGSQNEQPILEQREEERERRSPGRRSILDDLPEKTLMAFIAYSMGKKKPTTDIYNTVVNELRKCLSAEDVAALTVAIEECGIIKYVDNGAVRGYWEMLTKEYPEVVRYETFNTYYKKLFPFHNKTKPMKAGTEKGVAKIKTYIKTFQEMILST